MNWLRSLFAPARVVGQPIAAPFACDLILTVDAAAQEDVMALLGAVQEQFPASRIHLLIGFGSVQVSGEQRGGNGESACHQAKQEISIEQEAAHATAEHPQPGAQRNVVLLRHFSGGRVVAVSIPPKQQSNAVKEGVSVHGGESSSAKAAKEAS